MVTIRTHDVNAVFTSASLRRQRADSAFEWSGFRVSTKNKDAHAHASEFFAFFAASREKNIRPKSFPMLPAEKRNDSGPDQYLVMRKRPT
jgi:hypothetical protein